MAYAPQPELAERISAALRLHGDQRLVASSSSGPPFDLSDFLERLDEEVPAKWSHEVQRLLAQTTRLATTADD